jgi:hypothetical protein
MSNISVKIGVGFALLWCLIKYIIFLISPFAEINPMVMLNIFLLLCSIAVSLYIVKRNATEETNALFDIKNAMRAGFPYTIIVACFMYFYYAKINPEYTERLIADKEYKMQQYLNDPEKLAEFKKSDPKFELKTKEEIFAEMRQSPENTLSAGFTSTISLLAMLLLSTLYSILVTVVYRRIVFRD